MNRSTPKNHRIAQRDEGIDRPLRKPVNELLKKFEEFVGHACGDQLATPEDQGATEDTNGKPASANGQDDGRLRRIALRIESDVAGDALVILRGGDGRLEFFRHPWSPPS